MRTFTSGSTTGRTSYIEGSSRGSATTAIGDRIRDWGIGRRGRCTRGESAEPRRARGKSRAALRASEAGIGDFAVGLGTLAPLRSPSLRSGLTTLRQCPQAEKSEAGCAAQQIRGDVCDSVPCSFARDKNCPTNGGHLNHPADHMLQLSSQTKRNCELVLARNDSVYSHEAGTEWTWRSVLPEKYSKVKRSAKYANFRLESNEPTLKGGSVSHSGYRNSRTAGANMSRSYARRYGGQ